MFKKHLLYLTNQCLRSVLWQRNRVTDEVSFAADKAGVEQFASRVAEHGTLRTYLLIDLIEEDFRLDLIPPVGRGDRAGLIERKLSQIYRGTPYRYGEIQGREATGRGDNRVLYTAITNSELVTPWVDVLLKHRAPLVGIYSAPILAGRLLKAIRAGGVKHALIVTLHRDGGLRQSYFQGGFAKFSRVTPLRDLGARELALFLADEVRKTWQYLESVRNFQPGEALQPFIICGAAELKLLRAERLNVGALEANLVELADVAKSVGLKGIPQDSDAAPIFLQLLGRAPGANHFAQPSHKHYAILWRARQATYTTGAMIGLAATGLSLANMLDSRLLRYQIANLAEESRRIEGEHREIMRRLPSTGVAPQEMTNTVTFYRKAIQEAPDLKRYLLNISQVLDAFPNVHLSQLNWTATFDPSKLAPYAPSLESSTNPIKSMKPSGQGQLSQLVREAPPGQVGYYQIATLEAEIRPFDHNYREALDQIASFSKALELIPGLKATPVALPLDTSGNVILRGKAAPELGNAQARFALQLTVAANSK